MAFRKIIKTGDPDDIRTGFAGAVWDIVKMSSLIGAFVAFFSGMVLKGKLLMLAAESWTSISLVLLVLFLALFLSLGAVLLQLPGLIHRKREHQEAQSLSDTRLVLWVFSTFAVSWFSTFFFSVTSDITAEALRGFGMGEYLYDSFMWQDRPLSSMLRLAAGFEGIFAVCCRKFDGVLTLN